MTLFLLAEYLTCPALISTSVTPCTCCSPALLSNSICNSVSKAYLTYLKRWLHPVLRTVCQIHNLLSAHFCAAHLLHICLHWRHMLCTLLCKQVSFSTQVFLSGNTSTVVNSSLISLCSLFSLLSEVLKVTPQLQFSEVPVTVRHIYGLLSLCSGLPSNPSPAAPLLTPAFISSQQDCTLHFLWKPCPMCLLLHKLTSFNTCPKRKRHKAAVIGSKG